MFRHNEIIAFRDDEFDLETANNVDQAKELLKADFDYITERDGIMLFRRPKRFGDYGLTRQD